MKKITLAVCLATMLLSNNDISDIYNNFRIKTKPVQQVFINEKIKEIPRQVTIKTYEVLESVPLNKLNLVEAEVLGNRVYKKVQIVKNNIIETPQIIETNEKRDIFSHNNNTVERRTSALESNFRLNLDEKRVNSQNFKLQQKYKSTIRKRFNTLESDFYKIEVIE